jgi:hypothetical protein
LKRRCARDFRSKTHAEAADRLKREFPEWESEAFRTGFARGRQYQEQRSLSRQ